MTASGDGTAVRETAWWYPMLIAVLSLAGIGAVAQSAALVLAAGVALVFAGYAQVDGAPPDGDVLAFDREIDDVTRAGEEIEVTVHVENTGEAVVPELRVIDGVPDALAVTGGAARFATALRPGEALSFSYRVTAVRGTHTWEPLTVRLANRSRSRERTLEVPVASTIECRHPAIETDTLPVRDLTTQYAGRIRTDTGGSGTEFYATREYREGDPLRRVNWRRLAKTGELSTVDFHEERGVTVVLLIDARKVAYRAPRPAVPHAVDRSVEAATRIFSSLLHNGHRAGIAVFGPADAWLAPGAGVNHRTRATEILTNHPALGQDPPDREPVQALREERQDAVLRERVETLHRRLPTDAQVFCLSPCLDDYIPDVADYLDAHGHLVTLISPNPTNPSTPGRYIAALNREHRLRRVHRYGIPVIDWREDEPLEAALRRAEVIEHE